MRKFYPQHVWGITISGRIGPCQGKVTRKVECVRYFGREKKAEKEYGKVRENDHIFKEDLIRVQTQPKLTIFHKPSKLVEAGKGAGSKGGQREYKITENDVCF